MQTRQLGTPGWPSDFNAAFLRTNEETSQDKYGERAKYRRIPLLPAISDIRLAG
jgi:hypothetical protein